MGQYPDELGASVLNRIPVRYNYDKRYLSDKYLALPKVGYTKLFEELIDHPNIGIRLNTDYFDLKNEYSKYEKLFYTGPVDRFFDFKHSLT